jgi:hypothetical protein
MSLVGSHGLINKKAVASSHDINDEIIIVAMLEMAFCRQLWDPCKLTCS